MGRRTLELITYEPARKKLLSLQPVSQPTAQPKHHLSGNNCKTHSLVNKM